MPNAVVSQPEVTIHAGRDGKCTRVFLNGHEISDKIIELHLIVSRGSTTLNLKLAVPVDVHALQGVAVSRVFGSDGKCITLEELAEAVAAFNAVDAATDG